MIWDGQTLAADKQYSSGNIKGTASKLFKLSDDCAIAVVGWNSHVGMLKHWFVEENCDPARFPPVMMTDEGSTLIVAEPGRCYYYTRTPFPNDVEDAYEAWGSGEELALGALAMMQQLGHRPDALAAIEAVCKHSCSCGMGVDHVTFGVPKVKTSSDDRWVPYCPLDGLHIPAGVTGPPLNTKRA